MAAVAAALTFAVCSALELPPVAGVAFALFVLLAAVPVLGDRFGIRDI